jgi:GNAT superfamily N-acetyltransferase/2'-5' RNA ligase
MSLLDKNAKQYDNASTQINVPPEIAAEIARIGKELIPDEHLAGDGRVEVLHVTVKYGVQPDQRTLQQAIAGYKSFEVSLGNTVIFPEASTEATPVVIEVHGHQFDALHKAIAEAMGTLPDDFPYTPHITVAYVKQAEAQHYAGLDNFVGIEFVAEAVTLSMFDDDNQVDVPLKTAAGFWDEDNSEYTDMPMEEVGDFRIPPTLDMDAAPATPFMGKYTLRKAKKCYVVYDGNEPIAEIMPGWFMTKPEYRKQGIGTELLKVYKRDFPNYTPAGTSDDSRRIFERQAAGMPTFQAWLKSVGGVGGFLGESDANLVYEEDWREVADENDTDAAFIAYITDRLKDEYNVLARRFHKFKWPLPIYRCVTLNSIDDFDPSAAGIFWTWNIDAPEAYWGEHGHQNSVVLKAFAKPGDVDWKTTITKNLHPSRGEDEAEVTVRGGAKLQFAGYCAEKDFWGGNRKFTPLPGMKAVTAASPAQVAPEIPEVAPEYQQEEQPEEEEVQRDEPATEQEEQPKSKRQKKQPKNKLLAPKRPKETKPKKPPVETTNFKKWFGKSQVRDEGGKPLVVYHGTTHDFEAFDPSKTNVENYYGKALYFTSDQTDVGENYATDVGPDITSRIDNRSERIMQEWEDQWDDVKNDLGLGDIEEFPSYSEEGYGRVRERAKQEAKREVAGQSQGMTMPVYLSLQNPVVVQKNGGTEFEINFEEEIESGSGINLYNAMEVCAGNYYTDVQEIWNKIIDNHGESFNAWDFEQVVRGQTIEDNEGNIADGNFIAEVYQEMGFDGIIQDAYESFGSGRHGKPMTMEYGAKHYILWDPTKIKSALGNKGKFDPKNPSITAADDEKTAAMKIALNVPRLVKDFGQKFLTRVQQDRSAPTAYHAPVETEEQVQQQATALINQIAQTDPSPNKEYTAWIVGNYARGGINRWEDIQARIIPALKKFDSLKLTRKLPVAERDIMKVKGIEGLENLMEKYKEVEAVSEGQKERDVEKSFFQNGEAEIIHHDAQIKIIHPKSQKAACFFGINTRWCTAATEGRNYFEHYNKDGPLYIVLVKADNKRYQLHFQSDSYMDERDRPINTWDLTDSYPVLKKVFQPVVLGLMRNDANIRASFVAFVENPDTNMMLKAVDEDPSVIDRFPNAPEEVKWRAFCRRLGLPEENYDTALQGFVVAEYKNVEEFAEDRGDDTAKWAGKISSGSESLDFDSSAGYEADRVLDACSADTIAKVNEYIQFNHDKELQEWMNDNDETFPLSTKAIEQFISEADPGDLDDKLRSGWYSGEEAGSQDEIVGAFKSAVLGLVSGGTEYGTAIVLDNPNQFWDSTVKEILPLADAQTMVKDSPDGMDLWEDVDRNRDTEILKVQQPYYGFNGFSDEACSERVADEFYVSSKEKLERQEQQAQAQPKKRKKKPVASLLRKQGAGATGVGDLGLAKKIMHELMPVLGVQLPEPELKISNSPRSGWLGRNTWRVGIQNGKPYWGENTIIEIQKSILNDDNTLRRILAHELAHHADALVNGVEEIKKVNDRWTYKSFMRDNRGHGPSWKQWAQKFNAKYGADFVTKTSDETYVTEELELHPYNILLKRDYDGRLAYEQSARMTAKQKRYLDRRASDKDETEYRLTQTNDRAFFEGHLIGSFYWSRPKEAEKQTKLEELWNKAQKVLPSGAAKEQDELLQKMRQVPWLNRKSSLLTKMADGGDEVVWEYAQAMKDPKKNANYRQKWSVVPAARLKKIWTDYANQGFVRDEAGMRRIAGQVLDNIWKLQTNTILTGHTSESPSRYGSEILGQELPENYFEQLENFFDDDRGSWRISDYALDPLLAIAYKLEGEDNAENQLQLVDRALQITHPRSDLASWFVEGGSAALSQLFHGMELTDLEKGRKQGAVPQIQELPHGVSKEYDRVRWVYQQFLDARVQSMSWQDFQKKFPKERNSPLFTKVRQNRPKITTEDMERWMDEFDAKAKEYQNYEIEHGTYQDKATSFRDVEQLVLKINQSASAKEIIGEDPMMTEFLTQIAQGSQQSGHPVSENTVGWLRVDFIDDDWLLVDEVQSDLVNAMELGKKFVTEPTLESLMSGYKSETVKQKIRDMGATEQTFQMSKRNMLSRGYTVEKLDEMKQQLINLFKDWAEYGIASLIEIARRHGIKNVAIHTGETIAKRDPDLEADKAIMYYDQLAKSFGFQKQMLDVGDLKGNFWVRTASEKTAGKREEATTSMTVGTTDPNFPMPVLIRWEQGIRWRQVLKSVKAIVSEIAGRRVPWREIHIWASLWDSQQAQQEGWEQEKTKGNRVMYDVLHNGTFVSVGKPTAAPLGEEVIEASHKETPLSDTTFNEPELGTETNAYADMPEKVQGDEEFPALETLAPQMFEKEGAKSLEAQLAALRPQMAAAAQEIYDAWDQGGYRSSEGGDIEFGEGGICDSIAREIGGIIASKIRNVEVTDGGQDGDDHAWTVAYRGKEVYGIDIPHTLYERGGGYSWTKVPGVTFGADDVEIFPMDVDPSEFAKEGAAEGVEYRTTVLDSRGGELFCMAEAWLNGERIGTVNFNEIEPDISLEDTRYYKEVQDENGGREWERIAEIPKEVWVKMVWVEPAYRRKGIATGMYEKIKQDFPGEKITSSGTTPEGGKFREKLTERGVLAYKNALLLNKERAVETIRKLEAHAESAAKIGNPEEAKTFADKAQALRKVYGLNKPERRGTGKLCPECGQPTLKTKPYTNPTVPASERFMTYCENPTCDFDEKFGVVASLLHKKGVYGEQQNQVQHTDHTPTGMTKTLKSDPFSEEMEALQKENIEPNPIIDTGRVEGQPTAKGEDNLQTSMRMGEKARTGAAKSLLESLEALRPVFIQAAQDAYESGPDHEWQGVCYNVAAAILEEALSRNPSWGGEVVDFSEHHSAAVICDRKDCFSVDIPFEKYEKLIEREEKPGNKAYDYDMPWSFEPIGDVVFKPEDIEIAPAKRPVWGKEGKKFKKDKRDTVPGQVYLLHFDIEPGKKVPNERDDAKKPFHARHYLGWATDAQARIQQHYEGSGAKITQALKRKGISFTVARVWDGADRNFERRLKSQGGLSRHCPICHSLGLIPESRRRAPALAEVEVVPEELKFGPDYVEKTAGKTFPPFEQWVKAHPQFDRVVNGTYEHDPTGDSTTPEELEERYQENTQWLSELEIPLTIYRALEIEKDDKEFDINFDKMGIYWTWVENSADTYFGQDSIWHPQTSNARPRLKNPELVIVKAVVTNPNSIDFDHTLKANMTDPEENEITLKPGAKLKLVGMDWGEGYKAPSGQHTITAAVNDVESAIKEIDATFPLNPLNQRENIVVVGGNPIAVVEVAERSGRLRLRAIRSLQPRQGAGSQALKAITAIADKHGVEIELTASPYGPEADRLDKDTLQAWYRKNKFEDEPGYDPTLGYMVRQPKSAAGAVNIDWKNSMFEHYKLVPEYSWHEAGDKTDEDIEIGEDNWNMLVVSAFDTTKNQVGLPGKWVGSADFVMRGGQLESSNTDVDKSYWRQGIATAMYQYAEGLTGFRIKPHLTQSDAGRALWQQKGRPFGKDAAQKVSGEDVVSYVMKLNDWDKDTAYQVVGLDAGGDYVLRDFPLSKLRAGDDYDPEQAEQYSRMEGAFPPIVLGLASRAHRDKPEMITYYVIRDGNHRVAAAKLRGDTKIKAYVPLDSTKENK